MFRKSLPGLRPAQTPELLPPTLQPEAVLSAAPPLPRGLSFLLACTVYGACGAGLVCMPAMGEAKRDLFDPPNVGPTVVTEPSTVDLILKPPPPSREGFGLPTAPARPEDWTPPRPLDTPPEALPETLPTEDQSKTSGRSGSIADLNPALVLAGPTGPTVSGGQGGTARIHEVAFENVRVLRQVSANYPPLARLSRQQGDVVVLLTIDPDGRPVEVTPLQSPNPSLEAEALRVAREWRFEPATLDGRPVYARFRLTFTFRMK